MNTAERRNEILNFLQNADEPVAAARMPAAAPSHTHNKHRRIGEHSAWYKVHRCTASVPLGNTPVLF